MYEIGLDGTLSTWTKFANWAGRVGAEEAGAGCAKGPGRVGA
jgi:hypothetical protein